MSKEADRSSDDYLEAAFASRRASITEIKAVSVEWPLLKPDWSLSRRLFCVRKVNVTFSSVLAMNGRRHNGL